MRHPVLSRWFVIHSEDPDVRRRGMVLLIMCTANLVMGLPTLVVPLFPGILSPALSYLMIASVLGVFFGCAMLCRQGRVNAAAILMAVPITLVVMSATAYSGRFINSMWTLVFTSIFAGYASRPGTVAGILVFNLSALGLLVAYFQSQGWIDDPIRQDFLALSVMMLEAGVLGYLSAGANSFLFRDATASKELAMRERARAEEASLAKSQFLANMSHEFRTPLHAIMGYTELMLEEVAEERGPDARELEDLARIELAGKQLLMLINDVLDLSKVEAGHHEVRPETFGLARFVDELGKLAQPLMMGGSNRLHIACEDALGEVHTDQVKLRQILLNLLSNAAKFTQEGDIHLRVSSAELRGEPAVRFEVEDTGIGMDEVTQSQVFDAFVQANTSRQGEGTGLGLSLVRSFVELLGGELALRSAPGEGSCFTVVVPRA